MFDGTWGSVAVVAGPCFLTGGGWEVDECGWEMARD